MSAGWVAGSVRGRLLTRRRLGRAGARRIAQCSHELDRAVGLVAGSTYGRNVRVGAELGDARRGVGAVCLWHLRVLAGWLPPRGGDVVRVFASRFEMVNIGDRLGALRGASVPEPYRLGGLALAWPRVASASTADGVRHALTASVWGDPGTEEWAQGMVALEARWANWLGDRVPGAGEWAAGAAALVLARLVASGDRIPPAALVDLRRQLGRRWEQVSTVTDLAGGLPRSAAWVLEGVTGSDDLWLAEGRWWRRVDRDAAATLRGARPGPAVAGAAAARLVADAWWVQAALEAAAWGPAGLEAFDAVA